MYAYIKHYALNEQETNRIGVSTFANEQAIRQTYLRPFELAITEGQAKGIMTSFNRIGTVWAGAHYGLMTEVTRNEFGFAGMAVTDFAAGAYQDLGSGLIAGNDLWLNTSASSFNFKNYQTNPTIMTALRKATKNILYVTVNSHAMNGVGKDSKIELFMPTWQKWLIVLDIAVFGGAVATCGWLIFRMVKPPRKKQKIRKKKSGDPTA
jgi:beta-glucosidase